MNRNSTHADPHRDLDRQHALQAIRWLQNVSVAVRAPHVRDPVAAEAWLWEVLQATPIGPLPSRLATALELPPMRRVDTPAGAALRGSAHFSFCSSPVPVQVLILSDADWAASVHSSAAPDFAAVGARCALARACAARHWRFPHDFAEVELAHFVWALPWAGEPPLELDAASDAALRFRADTGSLLLTGTWTVNGLPGAVRLAWSNRVLAATVESTA